MALGKVAVFGASGLVGSRLCESLWLRQQDFRALIHAAGNAFRIARYPMDIESVELLDRVSIDRALRDCRVVVNCARGDSAVMRRGFENLVDASTRGKVEKFIHISSILIYGPRPPAQSAREDHPPDPQGNPYGTVKLRQDELLQRKRRSLHSTILCPPSIYGPGAGFTLGVFDFLKSGRMVLVDRGKNPCNVVHVDNLVSAALSALDADAPSGERFFIMDEGEPSWEDFLTEFAEMIGVRCEKIELNGSSQAVSSMPRRSSPLRRLARSLTSSEFRKVLGELPGIDKLMEMALSWYSSRDPELRAKIRGRFPGGTVVVAKEPLDPSPGHPMVAGQTRNVRHSIDKAKRVLGYQPQFDMKSGLANTRLWMRFNNYI